MPILNKSVTLTFAVAIMTSCSGDTRHVTDPSFSAGSCPITITKGVGLVRHPHHTSGWTDAYWLLQNSSGSNVSISGTGCLKNGVAVASCVGNNFGSYVPAGSGLDGDVTYATGPVGQGGVRLTVTLGSGCGTLTAPLIGVISE